MKGSTTALCLFLLSSGGFAAPVTTLDKLPGQSDKASAHMRQTAQQPEPPTRTRYFVSFFTPSKISIEKHNNIVVAADGQRVQLPDNLAGAKAWETPNVFTFLTSLARPKKQLPFPESSIIREETRGDNAEPEPEETIVELETKAERESWTYLPYLSQDQVLRFRCVRKAADTVILAVPVAAAAVVLVALLSSALRYTLRNSQAGDKSALRLDDEEKATLIPPLVDRPVPAACTPAYPNEGVKS